METHLCVKDPLEILRPWYLVLHGHPDGLRRGSCRAASTPGRPRGRRRPMTSTSVFCVVDIVHHDFPYKYLQSGNYVSETDIADIRCR